MKFLFNVKASETFFNTSGEICYNYLHGPCNVLFNNVNSNGIPNQFALIFLCNPNVETT